MTPNIFPMLGIRPLLGRVFTEAEGVANGPQVAVLSEGLWRSEFHADPAILGRSIKVGDGLKIVAGVMPGSFHFPDQGRPASTKTGFGYRFNQPAST